MLDARDLIIAATAIVNKALLWTKIRDIFKDLRPID